MPFRMGGGGGGQDKNLWPNLISYLKKKELLPVVCFIFSKKRCEENANTLGGQDYCSSSEKSMVHVTIERALKRLKGSPLLFCLFYPVHPSSLINLVKRRLRPASPPDQKDARAPRPRYRDSSRRPSSHR